jgi:hypothetical protein
LHANRTFVIEYTDPPALVILSNFFLSASAVMALNNNDPDLSLFGVIYSPGFWDLILKRNQGFKVL